MPISHFTSATVLFCRSHVVSNLVLVLGMLFGFAFIYMNGLYVFNAADGGYLWYGSWRTYLGEVPVHDFKSYDPGRYYWSACVFRLLGEHSLSALKVSIYVFYFSALTVFIYQAAKAVSPIRLVCLIILSVIWAYPEHKMFDIGISIMSVVSLAWFLCSKVNYKFAIAGIWIGVVSFFGRNHLTYNLLSFGIMTGYLLITNKEVISRSMIIKGLCGLAIGLMPFILLALFNEGFVSSYLDHKVYNVIWRDNANLTLPFPDFMHIFDGFRYQTILTIEQSIIVFLSYIIPLVSIVVFITFLVKDWHAVTINMKNALVIAASLLSLFYFHHYYSRADLSHLEF